jgi:excisionase family DNA binding protein
MTGVAAIDLVSDLVELERLAAAEEDDGRRRRLLRVHDRLATRSEGAKVSEAAGVLGLSVPTVRSWVEAGVLQAEHGRQPVRITYGSLAAAKRALDEIRAHQADRPLLTAVMRMLRDRDALDDPLLAEALEDLAHGRTRDIGPDDLDDLIPGSRRRRPSASR